MLKRKIVQTGDVCDQDGAYALYEHVDGSDIRSHELREHALVAIRKGEAVPKSPHGKDARWIEIPLDVTSVAQSTNRCVIKDCDVPPPNNAVPACVRHLCRECFMGVAVYEVYEIGTRVCATCLPTGLSSQDYERVCLLRTD